MDLWTIQTEEAWRVLAEDGVLRSRPELTYPEFELAYAWMAQQMVQRIGPPPTGVACPVWAWWQWQDARRRRPDLRFSAHLPAGTPGVLIHFSASPADVLLSDFNLWHYVLNDCYLPRDLLEGDAFEADWKAHRLSVHESEPLPVPNNHEVIQRSWERVFDLDWWDDDICRPRDKKSVQATLWELRKDQVIQVRHFVAR